MNGENDARGFALALVDADSATQALDLVFQVQLATLDFQDFQIIDREMLLSLGKLVFQRFMPHFEFNKVGLHGHRQSLLVSDSGLTSCAHRLGGYRASRRG
jgi:hypothetical protein